MKNHEWVDGKLLQTNKKYSHLKQKQKERIYQWMYDAYKSVYKKSGKYPDDKKVDSLDEALDALDKVNSDEVGREGGLGRDAIDIMTDSLEEEE